MGLFDGTGPTGEAGSTAELARVTGWPVVLVVDAGGQGASVAALVAGFARHDPLVPLAGVILNRVASERHRALLEALARHLPDLPVLGALRRDDLLILRSRHARPGAGRRRSRPSRDGDRPRRRVHRRRFRRREYAARADPDIPQPTAPPAAPGFQRFGGSVAIALDDCFLFAYESVLMGWRGQGVAISNFSPLADEAPDPSADAIYLPGGYPELHAGNLPARRAFLGGLRRGRRQRRGDLRRMRRLYGDGRGADRRQRPHPPDGRAAVAAPHQLFAEPSRQLGYRVATLLDPKPLFWGQRDAVSRPRIPLRHDRRRGRCRPAFHDRRSERRGSGARRTAPRPRSPARSST